MTSHDPTRRTPLYDRHIALGGRMVPFAGFEMPVQYGSILAEHEAVRTRAGIFDVSHMGEVVLRGPQAHRAIQEIITNDFSTVPQGGAIYSPMCHTHGGIVDDCISYHVSEREVFVCVNAGNRTKDFEHIRDVAERFDVTVEQESDAWGQLAVQGPAAVGVVASLCAAPVAELGSFRFADTEVAGRWARVSRTGYTGEDGFEIYLEERDTVAVFDALMETGAVTPSGLGARDLLRTEMKFPLYGSDITDQTNPLEANLGWTVKLHKESFVGREALVAVEQEGPTRRLVGLRFAEKCVPRTGYELLDENNAAIGTLSSGALSPSVGAPIGIGYLPKGRTKIGSPVRVRIRQRVIPGDVVKTPFYKRA